jgi:hypothetical protein
MSAVRRKGLSSLDVHRRFELFALFVADLRVPLCRA